MTIKTKSTYFFFPSADSIFTFSPQRGKTTNEVLNATSLSKKTYSLFCPSFLGFTLGISSISSISSISRHFFAEHLRATASTINILLFA